MGEEGFDHGKKRGIMGASKKKEILTMNYEARRQAILNEMEDNSLLILYSGEAPHRSADAYHHLRKTRISSI